MKPIKKQREKEKKLDKEYVALLEILELLYWNMIEEFIIIQLLKPKYWKEWWNNKGKLIHETFRVLVVFRVKPTKVLKGLREVIK